MMNTDPDSIYDLIARYDVEGLRKFITSRSDGMGSVTHPQHVTPLCAAFAALKAAAIIPQKRAARQIISLLLGTLKKDSPVVNKCNTAGLTPLLLAIECGEPEYIEQLIQLGAAVNIPGDEKTPLHFAVTINSTTAIQILLKHGADPNDSVDLMTLMNLMIDHENRDILWLLEAGHPTLLQTLLTHNDYVALARQHARFRIAMDLKLCTIPGLHGIRDRALADRLLSGDPQAWQTAGVPTDGPFCNFVVMLSLNGGGNVNAVKVLGQLAVSHAPGFQFAFHNAIISAARNGNIAFLNKLEKTDLDVTNVLQQWGQELIDELLETQSEELIVLLIEKGAVPSWPQGRQWSSAGSDFFSRVCSLGKRKVAAAALELVSSNQKRQMAFFAVNSPFLDHIFTEDDLDTLTLLDTYCSHHISNQHVVIFSLGFNARTCSRYLIEKLRDNETHSILEQTLRVLTSELSKASDIDDCLMRCREVILTLISVLSRKNIGVDRLVKDQLLRCSTTSYIVHVLTYLGANPCELLRTGLHGGIEGSTTCMNVALKGLTQFIGRIEISNLKALKRLALELLHPPEELCNLLLQCSQHRALNGKAREMAKTSRETLLQWQADCLEDAPDPLFDTAFISTVPNNSSATLLGIPSMLCGPDLTLFIKRWLSLGGVWPPVSLVGFLAELELCQFSGSPLLGDDGSSNSDDEPDDESDDE